MVTLKDIANKAGVSVNTVSCALRGSTKISKPVSERIAKLASEMGYMPNSAAVTLRNKKSRVIGLIVTDISNPVFGNMVKGAENAAREKGYSIIISNTDENKTNEIDALSTMISRRVDGIILNPTQHDTESLQLLKRVNMPFILMARRFRDYQTNYVVCDDILGGYFAAEYLVSKNHRNIVFINGPKHISSSYEREEGFRKALKKSRLTLRAVYYIYPSINEGMEVAAKLLDSGIEFTAVQCFDDYTAFGVMMMFEKRGVKVPGDVAVLGYDNTEFAEVIRSGLTSIDLNEYRTGLLSAEYLVDIIEDQRMSHSVNPSFRQVILEPKLIVRGST
jgi:LacI family transcriptional regulator